MPTTMSCFDCDEERPAALIATLSDGRRLSLCARCRAVPGSLARFVAACQAHAHAMARASTFAWHLAMAEATLAAAAPMLPVPHPHQPRILH